MALRKKRVACRSLPGVVLALTLAACGSNSPGTGGDPAGAGFGAALGDIVNQSSAPGGPLVYEMASTIDSADPGNTYETANWDFLRLYDRTMLSYSPKAGAAGLALEGDLATGLGEHNSAMTQWTYHIQPNATFSDGSTITTADVKYAIERSNWGSSLGQGPTYFSTLVQNTNNYQGPYGGGSAAAGVSGISTPDATTIVFTLNQPFADFNYLMTLSETAPVPPASDTGAGGGKAYQQHMVTSGAYKISSYSLGKQMVLVPYSGFVAASDPNGLHRVRASKITVNYGVDQNTIDQNLLRGSVQMDMGGGGVSAPAQSQILSNPQYKANADSVPNGYQTYLALNTQISPFSNVYCRQAVEYAVNKAAIVSAAGGSIGGGTVATTILPPDNTGYVESNLYVTAGSEGNPQLATRLVGQCKAALGSAYDPNFAFAVVDAADSPKSLAIADVVQQNLNAIGFNVTINEYSFADIFNSAPPGSPSTAAAARIGMSMVTWGADFPTGYGYMEGILTSAGIHASGGSSNSSFWNDTAFDGQLLKALSATTPAASDADYAAADQYAMRQAVIVPLTNDAALLYRPIGDTNVTVALAYGMYDYSMLGSGSN